MGLAPPAGAERGTPDRWPLLAFGLEPADRAAGRPILERLEFTAHQVMNCARGVGIAVYGSREAVSLALGPDGRSLVTGGRDG